MKFDSKSVLLNDGVNLKVKFNTPKVFDDYTISENVWIEAITDFNMILNERISVTEKVNGLPVDILNIEKDNISIVVHKENINTFENMWFSITGQLVFKKDSWENVDKIVISNIIYNDLDGNKCFVLNKD